MNDKSVYELRFTIRYRWLKNGTRGVIDISDHEFDAMSNGSLHKIKFTEINYQTGQLTQAGGWYYKFQLVRVHTKEQMQTVGKKWVSFLRTHLDLKPKKIGLFIIIALLIEIVFHGMLEVSLLQTLVATLLSLVALLYKFKD